MLQNATGPNGINSLTESPDNKGLNGTNEKQKIKRVKTGILSTNSRAVPKQKVKDYLRRRVDQQLQKNKFRGTRVS